MRIQPLILGVVLMLAAPLQAAESPRLMTITGEGRATAAPDMATISMGVSHQAKTGQEAMALTSQATAAMLKVLTDAGIAPRDIQTSDLSLDPQWSQHRNGSQQPPRVIGFIARNTVEVRVRALDDLGGVLDAVLENGGNRFHGLQFGLQDPAPLQDIARRDAVAEARHKAALYAEAAGVSLGRLVSLSEPGAMPAPKLMDMMMETRAAVPVAQGEVGIEAQVTLVYELAD